MEHQFSKIGIVGKHREPSVAITINRLIKFLKGMDYEVILDSKTLSLMQGQNLQSCELENLGNETDLVIAIGGDGTFLTAMRAIVDFSIPLIGINLGRVGFLVDISPEQIEEKLRAILNGEYKEEKRYLLHAQVIRDEQIIHEEHAVNEIVIHRWITPSLLEIVTHIDGVYLNSQRSDGLIISTPTGSTAYSLSAGGPIIHPALNALVLVPLSPHTLSNRPIVVNDSVEIDISFCQTNQIKALVSCDHLEFPKVLIKDKIQIKKNPQPITILHPKDHDYFQILRTKLNWSGGYPD